MPNLNVCILGGTGFVGRSITSLLTKRGERVNIITRRRERHRDLLVIPTVTLVEGDVYDDEFLVRQFQDIDLVINLIGILNERGHRGKGFLLAHTKLAEKVVAALREAGVPRLLHMSALHANPEGPSHYLRTKGLAENLVHERAQEAGYQVTSFRPSVIFGPLDGFTNRFTDLLRTMPLVFPLACPNARFQPIYVGDVARCFVHAVDDRETQGQRYNLCGPKRYTLREIVAYLDAFVGTRHLIIPLADWQSWLQATVMEWLPGKPFSLDNYHSLSLDSICEGSFPKLFGFSPMQLESILPQYLRKRPDRRSMFRRLARR